MFDRAIRALGALAACISLAACNGGSSSSTTPAPPPSNVPGVIGGGGLVSRIVGVGDSLTAGEQSNALLGADIVPNPLGASSPFPAVFNTQGNGYYALVWGQASGASALTPATSPLPLIAPPGVGSILLPTTTGGLTSIQAPCTGLNTLALSPATALQTRLNATSTPLDVAIPGQTLHEALFMTGVNANPCTTYTSAQLAGLASILGAENLYFNPILGNFAAGTTQIAAAERLRPTLALVWLGSNDILKFLFSNGAVAAPTQAQFQSDMVTLISSLQGAGAKVAVANLVDVLGAAQFTPVAALPQLLVVQGVPASVAPAIASAIDTFLTGFGVGQGGYLTLTGVQKVQGVVLGSLPAILGGAPPSAAIAAGFQQLQASANAFGAGDFVIDSIATQGAALNVAYNAAIGAAAKQTGAALVDVSAFYKSIEANGGIYPLASNPKCCSLLFGGGFFSFDGLHPSNTGYSVIASLFVQTVDSAYNAGIPPITASQIATINATDPYSPH